MRIFFVLLFCVMSLTSTAQGEASHWYFGSGAGLVFDVVTGDVTAVNSAQNTINTNEGCSSISDTNGNLLFYTDGRNVWDANHLIMPNADYDNGLGLLGDPSSTSSGLIVPRPNNLNQYYIFTVDEPHHNNAWAYPNQGPMDEMGNAITIYQETTNTGGSIPLADDGFNNGLNYSLIDLTLNGGFGDVVNDEKNVHLVTYDETDPLEITYKCAEKITAVEHEDGVSYWLITQFLDKFYAFRISEDGVNTTPVISQIGPFITISGYRRNAIGYLKSSPDGTKLAIAHNQNFDQPSVTQSSNTTGGVYLYNFDTASGQVSNLVTVLEGTTTYGVDFSADSKKLYATHGTDVSQFNLEASDVSASQTILTTTSEIRGAIQLAPNGKIYVTNVSNSAFLDVINNPEELGIACNYQTGGLTLASGTSARFGLPPFIQSFLIGNIQYDNTCFGDTTEFTVVSNETINAITWDFGDGTTSNLLSPTHVYSTIGDYNISSTITTDTEIKTFYTSLRISELPVANQPSKFNRCDDDDIADGFTSFNLSEKNDEILLGQNPSQFNIKYFETIEDATNLENQIIGSYTNVTNPQTIYARIENVENLNCYDITSLELEVFEIPEISSINDIEICDNFDNDYDGIASLNLEDLLPEINEAQNGLQTNITFHETIDDALNGTSTLPLLNYTNTEAYVQTIFIRVENSLNTDCFITNSFNLVVTDLPEANNVSLIQCDEDGFPDGITTFNLSEADEAIIGGNTNSLVSYYFSIEDAINDIDEIESDVFENSINPQIIYTKVTDTITGCVNYSELTLEISSTYTYNASLSKCDDDGTEDGFASFNLNDANTMVLAGSPAGLDLNYYETYEDALLESNALNTTYTNTSPYNQTIYARIENDNACFGISEIELTVFELPQIETEFETLYCLNWSPETIVLDAGLIDNMPNNYYFEWSTGETTSTIEINSPGTYSVRVFNTDGCFKDRTINVLPSNIAAITNIEVIDASDNNRITVLVSGEGDYEFALDDIEGPYQSSNIFDDVLPGLYTIYVRDIKNDCGIVDEIISVIGFPKFFTPNNDTFNDYWQVYGISHLFQPNSTIYIFDRYGKLLVELDPLGPGWDGTYNGAKMPTSDYWFQVKLEDGRIFTSHFTLRR